MTTETPVPTHQDDADEPRTTETDRRASLAGDEVGEGWQPTPIRWGWWMMVSALAVACTLFVVNWVGWESLPIAARLIVLVELLLVACLVLFLVLGERFSEWAGYGSLWATDERSTGSREGISRADRNWSRTAQLKQYLRRTYYEVKCQQSTVLPKEWRRSQPAAVSPRVERQGQNPPARREAPAIRSVPTPTPPVQSAPRRPAAVDFPVPATPAQLPSAPQSASEIGAIEAPATPSTPAGPKMIRSTSRLEVRRRQ